MSIAIEWQHLEESLSFNHCKRVVNISYCDLFILTYILIHLVLLLAGSLL